MATTLNIQVFLSLQIQICSYIFRNVILKIIKKKDVKTNDRNIGG